MITPKILKGFRDFLPTDAKKRNWLEKRLREIFELWSYEPLETPTIEPLELFKGSIGDDEKLFFHFADRKGRSVALRYDQTLPAVRAIAQNFNKLIFPFKRYQIQPAFRAEKPQKGRYREFLQCDADIFGDPSNYADANSIALSLDIYRQLGFKKVKVLINDRNLIAEIPYKAIVCIDKLKKIGEERVIAEMLDKGINKNTALKYLDIVRNLKPNESVNLILDFLFNYGFDADWFEFDPTIARSFSYSQGPIWEVIIPGFTGGSVLGGERYDGLFKKIFGLDLSGTGFGLGFDRTLQAAEEFALIPDLYDTVTVYITVFNRSLLADSLSCVNSLRKNGISCDFNSNPDVKLDKQFKIADRKNYRYVIIIGPEEAQKNLITLRNMKTKLQKTLELDQAIKIITKDSKN